MIPALGAVIVGAGDMGTRHALGWRAAGARVAAVVDPDSVRAGRTADLVGARTFPDLAAALNEPGVDVVSVCTPTYLHADATVAALQAGKHVLCEKPAALTLRDGERMRDAAEMAGGRLRIGFMRRFDPAWHKIQALCADLGAPVLAQATIAAGIRPKLLMHDANANGGPIVDMCCHVFDQWSLLFDERPSLVRAYGYTFGRDKVELATIPHKALDSAFITLEYPSGGVGQIQVSWGLPRGVPATETHTYVGPGGIVTVDWPRSVTLRDGAGETRYTPPEVDAWQLQIASFAREIAGVPAGELTDSVATIEDGLAALRTSLAVLASVWSSGDVRVEDMVEDTVEGMVEDKIEEMVEETVEEMVEDMVEEMVEETIEETVEETVQDTDLERGQA